MYIRIAFSIELRLRVSRSLRSLANYFRTIVEDSSVTEMSNEGSVEQILVTQSSLKQFLVFLEDI